MKVIKGLLLLVMLSILSCKQNPAQQHMGMAENVKKEDMIGNWQISKYDLSNRTEELSKEKELFSFTLNADSSVNIHFSNSSDITGKWKWLKATKVGVKAVNVTMSSDIQIIYQESKNLQNIITMRLGQVDKKLALMGAKDFIYTKL